MSSSNKSGGGLDFPEALTLIFIVLKLTGHIDWHWGWVFAPLWGTALAVACVALVVGLVVACRAAARRLTAPRGPGA